MKPHNRHSHFSSVVVFFLFLFLFFTLWTAVIYTSGFIRAVRRAVVELSEQWLMAAAGLNHIVREWNILLLRGFTGNTSLACWRSPQIAKSKGTETHKHTRTLPHAHTTTYTQSPFGSPFVVTLCLGWLHLRLSGAIPSSKQCHIFPISPSFSFSLSLFLLSLPCPV